MISVDEPQTGTASFCRARPTFFGQPLRRPTLPEYGFVDFRRQYPDLCEGSDVPPTPSSADVPLVNAPMKSEAEVTPRFRNQLPSSISQPVLSLAVGRRAPQSPTESSTPTAQITQVLDHVFLGSQDDAQNTQLLKRYGISRVINLSDKGPKCDLIADDAAHFMRIPILDSYQAKILPHFDEAFDFIESSRRAGDRVLIHCLAGISRSPTLAMAYVMRSRLLTCDEAYKFVKSRRPTVSPNLNFMGQLFEYERQLREQKILPPSTRPRSNILLDSCAEPNEKVETSAYCLSERLLSKSASADFGLLGQPPAIESMGTQETRKRQNESGPLAMPSRPRKLMQNCCLRRMTAADQSGVHNPQLPSPSSEFSKLDISFSNPCFNPTIPPTPSAPPSSRSPPSNLSAAPMTAENPVFAMSEKTKTPTKAERPNDLNKTKTGACSLFAPLLRLHKKTPAERPLCTKPKLLTTYGGRLRLRRLPMQRTPASVNVMPTVVDTDEDSGVASSSSVVYSSTSTDDSEGIERLTSPEEPPPTSPSASSLRESDEADCSSTSSVEIAVK